MVDSAQFVTDLTTIGDGSPHMIGYAQNAQAGYIEAPTNTQQQDGVVPLDRLPAQWWNWFLNQATRRFSEAETYIEKAVEELDGVLDVMGVSPDSTDQTQLKTMFGSTYLQNYLPKIAETATAFSPNGTHSNSLIVTDDDGNSGYSIKKVPYAPGLVVTTQITTAAKTITLPSNCPFDGQTIKVVFANGHEAANATDYMTLNSIPIVSNQNGTLTNLPIHELTVGTYSVLQNNTALEMYYTETGFAGNPAWVIVGNPVVLSSSTYRIHADGDNDFETLTTNETQTKNIWIDGKPIYRKIFTSASGSLTGIDTIVSLSGVALVYVPSYDWQWTTLGNLWYTSGSGTGNDYFITVNSTKTAFSVRNHGSGGSIQISSCMVIIEYTKV